MSVDPVLAQYSDYAFASSFAIYVLALVLSVVDFSSTPLSAAARPALVCVGSASNPALPGRIALPPNRTRAHRAGRAAVSLTVVALVLNVTALALRGISTHRWPLGNLYEYALFLSAALVACWLVILRRYPIRSLTIFVLAPTVVLLFVAAASMYAEAAPVVPALRSYWIGVHVTIIVAASGILTFASAVSALFIIAEVGPQAKNPALRWIAARLPSSELLDRVAYRTTIVGFPLFSIGVICGAIWAEAAWGRFWGWDPKETVSFISWVLYAAYLHARATAGFKNMRAAWINVAALATMLFNMFAINYVVSGLHSYAGLN
ncbi:c-type cytochrome biogenesis protein CcsB [Rhodococcus erythropolis]|uniref:c-type cytochrome biogenesis protein CcsB n=1 Tax=Rhodococcus erythropolis TaxID=1833 RepID=UPI001BE66F6D|nr:c-type cytochrome biogenesis protein CcsB [Rhodococcus erythropolis]MBT2267668.1 c-type cytochrome biogenesis protein CcsB [Rhodococcus erythropolis]